MAIIYEECSDFYHKRQNTYRVFHLTGPPPKSSKYGTGPPNKKKITKYTGPTQNRFLTINFS